jgi:hypothetical protein
MFTGAPRNNGIACGPSGILVIDEDVTGEFPRFAADNGHQIPDTYTVTTRVGRKHYYFNAPAGEQLGNGEGALRSYGVNVRGVGGYVVGAGSAHVTGAVYTANGVTEVADCPEWLIEALRTKEKTETTVTTPGSPGEMVPYLHRYDTLMRYACSLRERMSKAEAYQLLYIRWLDCVQPPGTVPEARYHEEPPAGVSSPVATWESVVTGILDDVWRRYSTAGEREAQRIDSWFGPGSFAELQAGVAAREAQRVTGTPTPTGEAPTGAQGGSAPLAPAARVAGGVRRVMARAASGIEPERVRWLWDGRLPLGALSLLGGREGIGKSTCAYQIAADITRGTLAGEFYGVPRAVAVAATEDSWPHTVVPRLMAAGADLDKVFRVDAQTAQDVETGLVLPEDLIGLKTMLTELGAVLLLLDPLMSRLAASLDTHKDSEVRQALEPLVKVAQDCDVSVLGIIHVNKSNSTDPLNSLMGSRAFAAVARSVLFCMVDPDDETEERRLLGLPKNNLGRTDLPTLAFRIKNKFVAHTDDGDVWTGAMEWLGEIQRSMRSLIETSQLNSEDRTAKTEAMVWLNERLTAAGGQVDSATATSEGKKAGHSLSSIKRARKELGIVAVGYGFPRQTVWKLPDVAAGAGAASGETEEGSSQLTAQENPREGSRQFPSQLTRGGRHLTELTKLSGPADHPQLRNSDSPCPASPVGPVGPAGAPRARREPTGEASPTRYTPSLPSRPTRPPAQTVCKHGQPAPCLQCYADTGSTAPTKRKESS